MTWPPPWYDWLERRLEPSWPLMVAIAVVIVGITIYLMAKRQAVPLAAWLTYLLMP
jgi:hypothetical protein